MRNRILLCVAVLAVWSLLGLPGVLGQSKPQPRKKIKDFGSSLKRLKWNPIKKETVETKPVTTQSNGDEEDVIRVETSLIAWDVLVVDKSGTPVRGLTGADFAVKEDGIPQEVGHFLLGDNQTIPRTIVLIIDYSGSQLRYLRNSINAAKVLVDQLAPLDKMAIVTDDVELILDFTDDKEKLKKKLESLYDRTKKGKGFFGFSDQRIGQSQQYSALMATLNEAFTEEDKRPIIVFQTDGDEIYRLRDPVIRPTIPPDLPEEAKAQALQSVAMRRQWMEQSQTEFSLADLYRAAEKSRATIYTVIPGFQLVGRTPEDQQRLVKADIERQMDEQINILQPGPRDEARARYIERWRIFSEENLKARTREAYLVQFALTSIAGRTGGWTDFLERPDQASSIYARIFSDINQRYIIGYYPTNKEHDGKRRRIDVAVKDHPEYTVLGRRSYYAPAP